MRRVSLLLLAVGLLVACNDKDDYQPEKDPIYLADKIVETILPVQGTHTMSITSEYKYRNTGIGLLEKMTVDTVATSKSLLRSLKTHTMGLSPLKLYTKKAVYKRAKLCTTSILKGEVSRKKQLLK